MAIGTKMIGSVQWTTIDREKALGALDIPHLESLVDALQRAIDDSSVRAVVLGGKGRAFCVGADIKDHGRHGGR